MVFRFLLNRFNKNSLEMFWFLFIFSYLLSFGSTNRLLERDFLSDRLQLAAEDVISLHQWNGQHLKFQEIPQLGSNQTLLDMVAEPDLIRGRKMAEMMNNLKERFLFQQTYLQKISDALRYAVRPNQIVVTPHLIRNLTIFNGITVNQIKSLTQVFWQNSKLTVNDLKYRLKDLIISINSVEKQIATFLRMTGDVVMRNKPSVITGHKLFVGHNQISSLNTTTAVIGSVGRQDLRQIMNDLYRKRRPQVIRGLKHIVRPTFVRHSLNSKLINGIDFNKQMVTTNSPQIIRSFVHFENHLSVVNHLTIGGKLNNIDVNRDLVFLNRPEMIPVPKTLTSPEIMAQKVNCLTISGIDLIELSQNVLMTNGLQTIKSNIILTKPLSSKDIKVDGMVNNVDISLMATQLVYKNRPVLVRGKKNFILDDFYVKNNLFVGHQIDGRVIHQNLLLRNRDQIISAPKVFKGFIRFDERVVVNGFVDGLRLPQDVLTLTRNEAIVGPAVFGQGMVGLQDIEAHHLVDGVDISELKLYSLKMNDRLIQSDVTFEKPVSVGAVQLNGLVNGIDLGMLSREAIFRGSPSVEISGTKTFASGVKVNQIQSQRVNAIDLNELVSTHKNETIFVPKLFTSLTEFNSLIVNGLVSGVNVTNLYRNRISLTKPEIIYGLKNFITELRVGNGLNVSSINGLVPQKDFVLRSKPQIITGEKIFVKPLTANKVIVKEWTSVKGTIDGISLNALNSNVIRLNSYLTTPLNIVLINSNSTFLEVFKQLNGLNVTHFANNVMSLSRPQIVFAPKTFRNDQIFSGIRSLKGISGISLMHLKTNAVHLNGFSQISSPFSFSHQLFFEKGLVVEGVVNGVNISYMASDAVYKSGNKLITGQNVFKSGFRVNGNIHSFSFNGIDLSIELLTNTRDHIIKGKVKFTKTLHINRDILINGRINGLDLSEFNKYIMKTNDRNIISGNLVLNGPTKVMTNLVIGGRLNAINLTQLLNDAVFLNSNQDIMGAKTITGPIHLLRNLNSTNLNGIDIQQLLNDIVYINSNKEQIIFTPKVFANDITSNGLIQSKGNAIMGPINGVNLWQLDSESIKTNSPTIVKLIQNFKDTTLIANNLTRVLGRINGIDLNKDVIYVNINDRPPQMITGNKVFHHLVINDNVLIDGLVNGFPLKAIQLNTFFTTNDQTIIGHKIVNGLLEFSADNNFVSTLNGLRVPEDLFTLNSNQTILGSLVFNDPLFVNRNIFVSGSVSGHNLTKLTTESLVKDRPQLISQPIKFDSVVFRRDVTVDQHVDSVDLSSLSKNVKQFTGVVNVSKELLELKANRHHFVSDYLFRSLEKSLYEIDSFTLYQSLNQIHGNHIQVFSDGVFTLRETIESPKAVNLIKFDPKDGLFKSSHNNENPAIIQKPFVLSGEEFVIHLNLYSQNISTIITKSGQLMATIASSVSFIEVLKISENFVILVSYQSNSGKLMVHSLEALPLRKFKFSLITEAIVGTETSKVTAFLNANEVNIVVTKQFGYSCMSDTAGTFVFVLKNYRTLELVQKIAVINVVDVVHFENNGKHYLALSDGTPIESSLSPQTIYIYRSELMKQKCSFSLFQKLYFDGVIQLSAFTYGTIHSEQQYLVAINSSKVMVWKQNGESGFTESWVLKTKSARVVAPLIADNNLFLIIGQRFKCHESLIFRGEPTGIAVAPIIFKTKYR